MENDKTVDATEKVVNGVNVTRLFQTVDAIRSNTVAAKFRFRLNNEWIDGGHNRSRINEYHGACQNLSRGEAFTLDADEPAILLGKDTAPNPVEYLLKALAACVTSSIVYHAAARGIEIEEIESTVEGEIDLRGFLGLDKAVRNGYQNIRMSFRVRAEISDEELQKLVAMGPAFSPVFDSVTKGVPISFVAERLKTDKSTAAA